MDNELKKIIIRKIIIGGIAAVWGILTLIGLYQPIPPTNIIFALIHYGLKYAFMPLGVLIVIWGIYELKKGTVVTL